MFKKSDNTVAFNRICAIFGESVITTNRCRYIEQWLIDNSEMQFLILCTNQTDKPQDICYNVKIDAKILRSTLNRKTILMEPLKSDRNKLLFYLLAFTWYKYWCNIKNRKYLNTFKHLITNQYIKLKKK